MRVRVAALREAPTPVQPNMAGACAQCNANQEGVGAGARIRARAAHMRRLTLSSILFWLLAAASAVLFFALVLIVAGVIPLDPTSQSPADDSPDAVEQQATTEPRATARIAEQVTTPAATTPNRSEVTVVVLSAVRGDSWFSARVGSESGRLLDERVLLQGESVRLRAERIWLSIGAASNIEVTVDGEPQELSGTVSVVLPTSGTPTAN